MIFYKDFATFLEGEAVELDAMQSMDIPEEVEILDILGPNENQDRKENPGRHSVTRPVETLTIDHEGIVGDRHRGMTRPSTAREAKLYARTRETIVNRRQVFVLSPNECEALTINLGAEVTPELLGANLVLGRPNGEEFYVSDLPTNTYLVVDQPDALKPGKPPVATLIQYVQQKGCTLTGRALETRYGDHRLWRKFIENSRERRGILCSIEYPVDKPAILQRGQKVFLRFPAGTCY
jgi:hypothetical protein